MDDVMELTGFSAAMAGLAARVAPLAVGVLGGARCSAILWQPDLVVTSAQALAARAALRVVLPGGAEVAASLVGRDGGTNLAVLRLATAGVAPALPAAATPVLGSLALALGSDGEGGATVRHALLHQVGPAWHSQAGGLIERRLSLDCSIREPEEGGPVVDAAGLLLGMSTLGPRGRVLVIPAATLARVVATLLAHGQVPRGWLGVTLQPVAVPEALRPEAGQPAGLMVLGLSANSPAAAAGVLQGDVLIAVDGKPVARTKALAEKFGGDSIGRAVALLLLRAGQVLTLTATITARPS